MVERSLSTLVQPRCMSWLLQRRGRVSNFGPCDLGSIPSWGKGGKLFFTCYRQVHHGHLLIPGQVSIRGYSVGRCVIPWEFLGKSVKHTFSCRKMYPV